MIRSNDIKDLVKNSLISISISLGIIFSLEIIYRFLRSENFSFSLINQERLKFKKIAFDNKYTLKEIIQLNKSVGVNSSISYKPWIQIGNQNHQNEYSIVENGNRKTINSKIECDQKKVIWFFGGSTTYGNGVRWNETLPSMFAEELNNNNICAKVINFGVPFHYSLQESFYMAIEIAKADRPKPDYIFFIDGLNDFIQIGSSIKKEPFFTPIITKFFDSDPKLRLNLHKPIFSINLTFIDYLKRKSGLGLSTSNYQNPYKFSNEKETTKKIINNIFNSNKFRSNICQIYQIKCYQFLQPVPFLYYEKNYDEKLTVSKSNEMENRFSVGYNMILRSRDEDSLRGIKIFNSSNIFLNYMNGIPYIDSFHYSPRGNKYFAENIYKIVFSK